MTDGTTGPFADPAARKDPLPTDASGPPRPIGLAPGLALDAAGQDAAKYATTNPVVQRLLARWMGRLQAVLGPPSGTLVDVGVGEGFALERMFPAGTPVVALEYRHDKAKVASERLRSVQVVRGDAGMLPFPDGSADLVTSIEVLEHLPTFEPAVAEMARICRGRLVVSVPWEPWFRLGNLGRGKNVKRLGNDPEHVQAFTPSRLEAALGEHFSRVRVVRAFPWLIAEASGPR
ncbi:MAG: class I SAM-dependent methyltransferase [Acidimicrobiia bacterium]|nr:class I SAM-dependent methyltransferase [Acidimicrobiia bacterium]